jgi:hypothetical protein
VDHTQDADLQAVIGSGEHVDGDVVVSGLLQSLQLRRDVPLGGTKASAAPSGQGPGGW